MLNRSPLPGFASPRHGSFGFGLVLATAATLLPVGSMARAQGMGAIVRSFCLSAFEAELARSGKTAPAGMADYACQCVADRLERGSGLDEARASCRQATARRFPI
jgi:hypothetical protein